MKSRKLSGILALVAALCVFAGARLAFAATADYYLEIKGEKQGVFKGEGSGGLTGRIFASQINYAAMSVTDAGSGAASATTVQPAREPGSALPTGREAQTGKANGSAAVAPRDVATGQMSGKRQHSDISIVKAVGDSSPMFARAMSTGEVLTSVDFSFFTGSAAKPEIYKTIHMTNVMVTSIKAVPVSAGAKPMESITFTAESQNIEAKNKNGGKSAIDDWSSPK